VQQRAEKFGKEAAAVVGEKGKFAGSEIKTVAKRGGRSLGDVIIFLVKAFAYFIIGCVSFALVVGLFALAVVSVGLFPLKDFLLTEGWQNALAWGTLLFFIAVPVIGIITWIIRRLTKTKNNRKILRASFISLWIVGWVCFICLIASISKDFKSINNVNEQDITLNNPGVNKLELTTNSPLRNSYRYNSFRIEPFEGWDEDTVTVKNIEIKIIKSPNDSFRVTILKVANGRTKRFADTLANLIQFNVEQKDSLLVVDKGIAINRKDKFRNQRIVLNVYVPVGKQIKIDKSVGWGNNNVRFDGPWNEGDYFIDRDDEEGGWQSDVDYIMKADGLYTLDGRRAEDWDNDHETKVKIGPNGVEINDHGDKIKIDKNGIKLKDGSSGDGYRYNSDEPINKIDSMKSKLEKEQQRVKDSLEKVKQNVEKQLEKISDPNTNKTEASVYPAPLFIPFLGLE
jgi:hypothetical protein